MYQDSSKTLPCRHQYLSYQNKTDSNLPLIHQKSVCQASKEVLWQFLVSSAQSYKNYVFEKINRWIFLKIHNPYKDNKMQNSICEYFCGRNLGLRGRWIWNEMGVFVCGFKILIFSSFGLQIRKDIVLLFCGESIFLCVHRRL